MTITIALADSSTYQAIIVRDNEKYIRLEPGNIFYIKSCKNYCMVYALTQKKYFLVRCTMTQMEERMGDQYCRIHDQYIIPLIQIDYPSSDLTSVILKCREELPISESRLPKFKKAARLFT